MNEHVKNLIDAIKADDQQKGIEAAGAIASQLLNDLHRVADALEKLASQNSS
jgi:hypothetical protein